MINSVMKFDCDTCYGYGLIFLGDEDNYSVETCQCVGDLFTSEEAN